MYVRQIDFTQDLSGFFMFLGNLFEFLREFGKLIGMNFAKEYNQLLTCI